MSEATDRLAARMAALGQAGRHRAERRPTLGQIALDLRDADPMREVVRQGDTRLTRADMVDRALRLAGGLDRLGLTPGAAIAFQLPNWWEATIINLAAALTGYRVVPLLPIYRRAELTAILPTCGVEAIFIPPAGKVDYPGLVASLATPPKHVITVRGDGPLTFDALMDGPPAAPRLPDSRDAKLIIFTSGSTGAPKGVIHTHDSLDAVVRHAGRFWSLGDEDVLYVPSPIGHIGGSIYAFEFPWITGCRTVLEDQWDAERAVSRIAAEGATFMAGATPFLTALLSACRSSGTALPSLRRFICGGASVPPDLVRDALRAWPQAIVSRAYGSTEIPLACPGIRDRAAAEDHTDTDGELAVDHRLDDGEILLRGPQMFPGYLDPAHDAGAFTEDGFFRMGDLARIVEDRFVVITGRRKDIIIRKGENISPLEIENALLTHPHVDAVAVVGTPEPERGEMVVAFVVGNGPFGFDDMTRHLTAAGLARQKFPERLEHVEALPMNAVGKVQKPDLRKRAAELVAGTDGSL
ncbi:AMP-binding protein [Maritimibacter sp. UBA3975]|uniref:AMP-binding protein n=1 Tax=Maritimibacter sp. UBA3975 TaxID=1946833 RepID=UPI000C0B296D|nr:AMP-binding protein [Maritimibacter sp. UBA3975]MAM62194.1 cyclohexanecarboxylate-CoA ligase [Maritimibacter sp.]